MANIASGFISVGLTDKSAAIEFASAVEESGLFSYGGDVDIQIEDDEVAIGFSSRWHGESCWDWIDSQLSENSQLSQPCQSALLNSDMSGYTYEYGCQHRDRVKKAAGENKLEREQANIPNDIATALKITKAFDLHPKEQMAVSGGIITLVSKGLASDVNSETVYSFSIACGYSLQVTLSIKDASLQTDNPAYKIIEIDLEDWDPDEDDEEYNETSMFKEIMDDMVADCDQIYE